MPQGLSSCKLSLPESPEINLKGHKNLLGGLAGSSQKIEQSATTDEQCSNVKHLFQVGTPGTQSVANHAVESQLAIRHMLHSIKSVLSSTPESQAKQDEIMLEKEPQSSAEKTTDAILD